MSNLKQIGLALVQYTQDYDEKYPLVRYTSTPEVLFKNTNGWPMELENYGVSRQLLQCPSEPNGPKYYFQTGYSDYAYNMYFGVGTSVSLSSLTQPSLTVAIFDYVTNDGYAQGATAGRKNGGNDGATDCVDNPSWCSPGLATFPLKAADRHLGGQNVAFADGHVKWYRAVDLGTGADYTESAEIYNGVIPAAYPARIRRLTPVLKSTFIMKPVAQSKILWVIGICLLPLSCAITHAQPVNIALEKTVTFNSKPNYPLCSDSDDNKQLTDGKYSAAVDFQKQKTTVGWRNAFPIIITIDLGSVQSISGVSYSTITGEPGFGLSHPTAIYIATSDDQKTGIIPVIWLIYPRIRPATTNTPFRYTTHDLQTKGRYISFAVVQPYDAVMDEIEVYKGDATWLYKPADGAAYSSVNDIIHEKLGTTCATRRLNDDIETIRRELQLSSLPATQKSTFNTQLDTAAAAVKKMPPFPTGSKTLLPLNDVHRGILMIHGEILAAEKFAPLTVWKQHRYAWLPFLKTPDTKEKVQLKFSMLRNQFRSDVLLLTNASGKSKRVSLRLNNFPADAKEGWIKIYSAAGLTPRKARRLRMLYYRSSWKIMCMK